MLVISKQDEAKVKALIESRQSTAKIKGAVHYLHEGKETDAEVREYLKSLGFASIRSGSNFRADFYNRLLKGNLDTKEFDRAIADASDNTIKYKKHFDAIRLLANKVREQAKQLELEAKQVKQAENKGGEK